MDIRLRFFMGGCLGAFIDPFLDESDLLIAERRLFVRHLRDAVVGAFEGLHNKTVRPFAGAVTGSTFAAFKNAGGGVHAHLAFLLGRAMATIAMLGKNGLHLAHVIDGVDWETCRCKQGKSNELAKIAKGRFQWFGQ